MEQWADIRCRVMIEGSSRRQIQRETGLHWKKLKKVLENSAAPLSKFRGQDKYGTISPCQQAQCLPAVARAERDYCVSGPLKRYGCTGRLDWIRRNFFVSVLRGVLKIWRWQLTGTLVWSPEMILVTSFVTQVPTERLVML